MARTCFHDILNSEGVFLSLKNANNVVLGVHSMEIPIF